MANHYGKRADGLFQNFFKKYETSSKTYKHVEIKPFSKVDIKQNNFVNQASHRSMRSAPIAWKSRCLPICLRK